MQHIHSLDPGTLSTPVLQQWLQAAVAPRPVAFVSTTDAAGQVNLSPFSFYNLFSSNPPILVFSPARRGTDGTTKHTLDNVLEVPEAVVNVVPYAIVAQMSLASTEYEKGVNEFIKSGLTPVPSDLVRPPRVAESPVAFECVVDQVISLGASGGAGNLVLARVVRIHAHTACLTPEGLPDTTRLDLVARMGGNWYCRASGDALFEIPKPLRTRGIGVDQLPAPVRESTVLTGNELGRLGNAERVPDAADLEALYTDPDVISLLSRPAEANTPEAWHRLAQRHLAAGHTAHALALLFFAEKNRT
ncbi:MAG: flavin reductase family protein [Bacteroidia bacterium]|nr:flavin reductase family protein [Bacteroidia bacterium]